MILTYIGVYLMSYLFASLHYYVASGTLLMAEAIVLYIHEYRRTGHIINVSGIYSLSLVGGEGISCLKLSHIQTDWAPMTWICFFLAYICFRIGIYLSGELSMVCCEAAPEDGLEDKIRAATSTEDAGKVSMEVSGETSEKISETDSGKTWKKASELWQRFTAGRHFSYERLLKLNCLMASVSWAAFIVEARVLGFIPFFVRGIPHAYSVFHISGVHYFTVSVVLCPALSLIWFMKQRMNDTDHDDGGPGCLLKPGAADSDRRKRSLRGSRVLFGAQGLCRCAAAVLSALSGFVIPVLCVSRFQLVFALVLAVFVWLVICENRRGIERRTLIKLALGCVLVLIPAYIVLTAARSHDAEYLKGIFEMKKDYPIVFSHFYIYVANNFDNFDCMVKNLTAHTWGVRQLFPLWALTGLKFIFPQLVRYDYFLTKKELTTLTLFYDTYYDFGVIGIAAFAILLGMVGKRLEHRAFRGRDAGAVMLYGQFAIYMALAFFTTWFSNPTTWFYIGVTVMIYVLSWRRDPVTDARFQKNNGL